MIYGMEQLNPVAALAALGHDARLEVFRLLVRAEPEGLPVGEIARLLEVPASTLSHHLGALVAAGLVSQRRVGRTVLCRADVGRLRAVFAHVEADCCAGVAPAADDAA
jgi:DNA-binding transcriptional ArsR family regulator